MFRVKLVARPDPRMVEVPLEIEAELPRDFDGTALLSSSGLPRKVKIKAERDALKLSTAYRADQLLCDIVRTVLRGGPQDQQKVVEATRAFVRTVRERRQDGAALLVELNGRGRIDVKETGPAAVAKESAAPQEPQSQARSALTDRVALLERRVAELEAALIRSTGAVEAAKGGPRRMAQLEDRIAALQAQLAHRGSEATERVDAGAPSPGANLGRHGIRRATAVDAFAEGLRSELRERIVSQLDSAKRAMELCDKAAALAAEAEKVLGAPREAASERLRETSAQAAARYQSLERLGQEIDLYPSTDLPLAERLAARLEEGFEAPDPAEPLLHQAKALVEAARGDGAEALLAWMRRAAALCKWTLIEPTAGEPLSQELHAPVDEGGDKVVRVAAPGLRRGDGSVIAKARVLVGSTAAVPAVAAAPAKPAETAAKALAEAAAENPPPDDAAVEVIAEEELSGEIAPPAHDGERPPPGLVGPGGGRGGAGASEGTPPPGGGDAERQRGAARGERAQAPSGPSTGRAPRSDDELPEVEVQEIHELDDGEKPAG